MSSKLSNQYFRVCVAMDGNKQIVYFQRHADNFPQELMLYKSHWRKDRNPSPG
jgi:hypothetical protein